MGRRTLTLGPGTLFAGRVGLLAAPGPTPSTSVIERLLENELKDRSKTNRKTVKKRIERPFKEGRVGLVAAPGPTPPPGIG